MKRTTLNFGPFGVYLWGGILLTSGLVFAGGAALTVNNHGTIYTQQLANGTPTPGKFVRAGHCTDTSTSTSTTDRQCWSTIRTSDVEDMPAGLPTGTTNDVPQIVSTGTTTGWSVANLAGTPDYIPKRTAGGWADSALSDDGFTLTLNGEYFTVQRNGSAYVLIRNASDASYPYMRFSRRGGTLTSPTSITDGANLGRLQFFGYTNADKQAANIIAYAETVAGTELVGKVCTSVSDGTGAGVNVEAMCVHSDSVQFNIPQNHYVSSERTWSTPLVQGTTGQVMVLSDDNGSTQWSTIIPPGGTPGQGVGIEATTATKVVTATSSQTAIVTATQTTTGTSTGTYTRTGTSSYTWTATGIGTGTGTEVRATGKTSSSALGNYYLSASNCEGICYDAWKLQDVTNASYLTGFIESVTMPASCSLGSDGLIGDFIHTASSEPWPVWGGGLWAAHIKATSTGTAAIRVEVWDSVDGQLFSMTTPDLNSPGPSDFYAESIQPPRLPSVSTSYVHFKLYAVCDDAASVSVYSDRTFSTWIETPLHSDKQDAQNVRYSGTTVYDSLMALEARPVATRSVFVSAFDFANSESLSTGTRGSGDTYARHLIMPDGGDSAVHSYYWKTPADKDTGDVVFRPLWVPITTDADYSHKVVWEVNFADVSSGDSAKAGTTFYWNGDTSFIHTGTAGFVATSSILESGGEYAVGAGTMRITVKRGHSRGGDTYVGNVGLIGLQIDYPSRL